MKRYLLDTNALLWILDGNKKLSQTAREIVEGDNDIYVSDVSLWEIAIKNNIGKLEIEGTIFDIEEACRVLDFERLPIKTSHFECLRTLPIIHQDPFDRLIISQAMVENMVLISSDHVISGYNVDCIW